MGAQHKALGAPLCQQLLVGSSCISVSSAAASQPNKTKTTQDKTWLCHFPSGEPLAHIPLPSTLQVRCSHPAIPTGEKFLRNPARFVLLLLQSLPWASHVLYFSQSLLYDA